MNLEFEELTKDNFSDACNIDRADISEQFVENVTTIMQYTDYGVENHCIGHTFLVKADGKAIGTILLGEAIPWDTDPEEMRREPFYRLMGFVIDKKYRSCGIGGEVLEKTIEITYRDFGKRPIALGCHKDNIQAEKFYLQHGFKKTGMMEGNDYYFLRYIS